LSRLASGKVSTYLPPLRRAVKHGKGGGLDNLSAGSLVSFPTRANCGLVLFHNKNTQQLLVGLRNPQHSFAVFKAEIPGTLFARLLVITHDLFEVRQ